MSDILQHTIYMDYAATTPVDPVVLEAMSNFFVTDYGNPSSMYSLGQEGRKALDEARERIAKVLNSRTGEIVFTSGGTESDNSALLGSALALREHGQHIITSSVEHHAVLHAASLLEELGFEVTYLPVDNNGFIDVNTVAESITNNTTVVSVMLANNEVGTIQPVAEIAEIVKSKAQRIGHPIVMHTDAVQAAGFLDLNVQQLGVDMLSLSAHKFHGPKGVGLLFIKRGTPFRPIHVGGSQERDRRAGTENVAGIVGMSVALELSNVQRNELTSHTFALRNKIITSLFERLDGIRLNGPLDFRLPNNVNVSIEGIEAEPLLLGLDLAGIAASSGSACTAASLEPSHVLLAMGLPESVASSSLRLSLGQENTTEEIDYTVNVIVELVNRLRLINNARKVR